MDITALSTDELMRYAYLEAKTPLELELLSRLQAAVDEVDVLVSEVPSCQRE